MTTTSNPSCISIDTIIQNLSSEEIQRFYELNENKEEYHFSGREFNDEVPLSLPELFRWEGFKYTLSQDTNTVLQIIENGKDKIDRYWIHHPLREHGELVYDTQKILKADTKRNGLVMPSLGNVYLPCYSKFILGSGASGDGLKLWGGYGNDRFAATLLTKTEFEEVRKFLPGPERGDLNGLMLPYTSGIHLIRTELGNFLHVYAFNIRTK